MIVQPADPVSALYQYFLDLKDGKLAPAVKDPKKSQAEILEELKPVLTTMMQQMVEAQVRFAPQPPAPALPARRLV